MVRALALERRLGKGGILDRYLVLAPYGGNLQGVRAASLAYFGHEPRRLSLAEAALLVALPQSPERRRPDRYSERGQGGAGPDARARASNAASSSARRPRPREAEPVPDGPQARCRRIAPHARRRARAGPIRNARLIHLTLDGKLQRSLEDLVRDNASRFGPAMSGALLVIDNASGEIRAHVGAADYRSVAACRARST